jgi:hypothetical protein
MLHRVVWKKFTDVSEVLAAYIIRLIIALMMEAASTTETSINLCQITRRKIPEDSCLDLKQFLKVGASYKVLESDSKYSLIKFHKVYSKFVTKCIKLTYNGVIVYFYLSIRSLKLFNGYQWNLALEVCIRSCLDSFILIRIACIS